MMNDEKNNPLAELQMDGNGEKNNAEFVSKMQVGIQELDETVYWLELLVESNPFSDKKNQ